VILKEVARGKSNKLIAEKMHMSQRSLEYALTQVFQKLSVHSRVEAVSRLWRIRGWTAAVWNWKLPGASWSIRGGRSRPSSGSSRSA
jgi:hypothetical protein